MTPKSRITGGETEPLFRAKVLGKHDVGYFRCKATGFIQTDDPHWLDEAYSSAITALDLGIISRNYENATLTQKVIGITTPEAGTFLDYAGGYGIFTRLMRDRGYNFKHHDVYCENIFAKGHAVEFSDVDPPHRFDLTTGWEIMEHLTNPAEVVAQILSISNALLFSTTLVPNLTIRSVEDWWYFTPETGQHISFYTRESLEEIAVKNNSFLYTTDGEHHLISKYPLRENPFIPTSSNTSGKALRWLSRKLGQKHCSSVPRRSLLQSDFEIALTELRKNQLLKCSDTNPND